MFAFVLEVLCCRLVYLMFLFSCVCVSLCVHDCPCLAECCVTIPAWDHCEVRLLLYFITTSPPPSYSFPFLLSLYFQLHFIWKQRQCIIVLFFVVFCFASFIDEQTNQSVFLGNLLVRPESLSFCRHWSSLALLQQTFLSVISALQWKNWISLWKHIVRLTLAVYPWEKSIIYNAYISKTLLSVFWLIVSILFWFVLFILINFISSSSCRQPFSAKKKLLLTHCTLPVQHQTAG